MYIRLCIIILLLSLTTKATDFYVNSTDNRDTVRFESPAKLEFISGVTHSIKGYFSFNPNNLDSPVGGIFKVDLRTLRTGIVARDEHMRNNHLKTDSFPFAYFEIQTVSDLPMILEVEKEYRGKVLGDFYIHGVKRPLESELRIFYYNKLSEAVLDINIDFAIYLDDYKIPRPKALFLKLAEKIEVRISLKATNSGQKIKIMLPQWGATH